MLGFLIRSLTYLLTITIILFNTFYTYTDTDSLSTWEIEPVIRDGG